MKTFINKIHPEARDDEVFIGNFDGSGIWNIGRKTKRRGSLSLGVHGNPLNKTCRLFPIFVKRSEMESAGYTIIDKPIGD